jgi:hypothetical protein
MYINLLLFDSLDVCLPNDWYQSPWIYSDTADTSVLFDVFDLTSIKKGSFFLENA